MALCLSGCGGAARATRFRVLSSAARVFYQCVSFDFVSSIFYSSSVRACVRSALLRRLRDARARARERGKGGLWSSLWSLALTLPAFSVSLSRARLCHPLNARPLHDPLQNVRARAGRIFPSSAKHARVAPPQHPLADALSPPPSPLRPSSSSPTPRRPRAPT